MEGNLTESSSQIIAAREWAQLNKTTLQSPHITASFHINPLLHPNPPATMTGKKVKKAEEGQKGGRKEAAAAEKLLRSRKEGVPRSRSRPPAKVAKETAQLGPRHTSAAALYDPSMEPKHPWKQNGEPGPWEDRTEPQPPPPTAAPSTAPKYRFSSTYAAPISDDDDLSDSEDDGGDPEQRRDFVAWVTNATPDYGQSEGILFTPQPHTTTKAK